MENVLRLGVSFVLLTLAPTFADGIQTEPRTSVPTLDESLEEEAGLGIARDRVYPALVNISVVNQRFGEGRKHHYPGAGSGVLVTEQGHVLTNFHVAGGAHRISCTLTDGRVLEAEIVVDDPLTDLTVLRLVSDSGVQFPHAELNRDDEIEVGDRVYAMGNPLALSSSMTRGIVSNRARVFTDFTGTQIEEMTLDQDELSGLLTRWIQHDALILPGNSGGPLVNARGQVVGINELGGRGMGFAIPASIASDVLEQALAKGRVERGWLGVSVLPVGRLGRESGALVSSVLENSAAATAGLLPGDILLEIDGVAVQARFFEEIPLIYQAIAERVPGSSVRLTIERSGVVKTLSAKVSPMPKFKGSEWELSNLGVTVQEITEPMAIARRFPDQKGLLLTSIRPGSPADAARPRLSPSDVLLEFAGERVRDVESLGGLFKGLKEGTKGLLRVRRGDEELLALVPAPSEVRRGWGGELPKAWLGVLTQVLDKDLSAYLGLEGQTGFRVTQVLPWTEAQKGGLLVGDIIVSVDDEPTQPTREQQSEDLRSLIEERYIDDTVHLSVIREGQPIRMVIRLEPRPRAAEDAKSEEQQELDFKVRDLTFSDRIKFEWGEDQQGVLVVEAMMGGWAQMAGLHLDDLILSANGLLIDDVPSFSKVLKQLVEEAPDRVQLFVKRGYRTHFVFIEPDWEITGDTN